MLVTLAGMVMLSSALQYANAPAPILVTLAGMVMLVSPVQPQNAEVPRLITPFGITLFLQPEISVPLLVFIMQFSLL